MSKNLTLTKRQFDYYKQNRWDYIVTENINLVKRLRAEGFDCPIVKNRYGCFKGFEKDVFIICISEDVTKLIKEHLHITEPGDIEIINGRLEESNGEYVIDSMCEEAKLRH